METQSESLAQIQLKMRSTVQQLTTPPPPNVKHFSFPLKLSLLKQLISISTCTSFKFKLNRKIPRPIKKYKAKHYIKSIIQLFFPPMHHWKASGSGHLWGSILGARDPYEIIENPCRLLVNENAIKISITTASNRSYTMCSNVCARLFKCLLPMTLNIEKSC